MGKGFEQTYHQRRYVNGQYAHEKMLNIIHHQGNTDQSYNEIQTHAHKNGYNWGFSGGSVVKNLPCNAGDKKIDNFYYIFEVLHGQKKTD